MFYRQFIVTSLLAVSQAQVYFPEDAATERPKLFTSPPIVDLTRIRGTPEYQHYVDQIISKGILRLTLTVDRALISTGHPGNLLYAPVSISGALALLLLAANGRTFDELTTIMGLATGVDIQNESRRVHDQFGRMIRRLEATSGFEFGSQVNFASAIFVQDDYPIRTAYKENAELLYESEILNLDFRQNTEMAMKFMDAWVSDRTKGKISSLLEEPPSPDTNVIIASAMYFKAEWQYPFFEGTTTKRPFYTNGRQNPSTARVEMMANGGDFPYYKDPKLGCEIIGFPYKGNRTTMYVVVPQDSSAERLKLFHEQLTMHDFERLVNNTKYTEAIVTFPKMKIESTINLRAVLQKLGLNSLFNPRESNLALLSPGLHAAKEAVHLTTNPIAPKLNFDDGAVLIFSRFGDTINCTRIFDPASKTETCEEVNKVRRGVNRKNIVSRNLISDIDSIRRNLKATDNPGLYADQVVHKVFMEITETGTESAATTVVSLARSGTKVSMRVDVPFLFFIMHEDTRTVLFWGSINTPTPTF